MVASLGSTPGIIVGVGVGAAASAALEPAIELPKQDAWARNTNRVLDPGLMARLVAEGGIELGAAYDDASREGFSSDKVDALVYLAQTVPVVSEAMDLWRRTLISDDLFTHVLVKSGLDQRYVQPILDTKTAVLLTPAQIALGIVRSVVADQGLLAVDLDTSDSNVARYPVYPGDGVAEAAMSGVDEDRLRVMVGEIGLPPGAQTAASAFFRSIITQGGYYQAILEGDTRPEWADAILEQAREILTAHDYVEGRLRGWITDDETMLAKVAQHGMSVDDATLLFNNTGRPLAVHQITKGKARGGSYNADPSSVPADYLKAIEESNIRPEWYELAFLANQYTWPGYFVLKALTPATITVEECTQILTWSGWEPTLAKQTAESFAGGGSSTKQPTEAQLATLYEAGELNRADFVSELEARGYSAANADKVATATDVKPLSSARTAILTKLRNGVVGGSITPEQATAELAQTTVAPATIPALVAAWQHENAIEHLEPPAAA
ncbi:MAG TPA: hypothetical protein VGN14_14435 [Candidatus Elarobacter sp.]|jgi:hypothetical protein